MRDTKERVWMQLFRIPCNYIITPNTSPPLYFHYSRQILQFSRILRWSAVQNRLFVCLGFFEGLFHSLVPHFSSETLADLDPTLGAHQFCFPTWAQLSEGPLYKPLCSSAQHIKAASGIHHYFYAAELVINISENRFNVCRNFRPCQKMAYHCVSKPYLYTVFSEISAIKCTYVYKHSLFTMPLVNLSRNFPSFHTYPYVVYK